MMEKAINSMEINERIEIGIMPSGFEYLLLPTPLMSDQKFAVIFYDNTINVEETSIEIEYDLKNADSVFERKQLEKALAKKREEENGVHPYIWSTERRQYIHPEMSPWRIATNNIEIEAREEVVRRILESSLVERQLRKYSGRNQDISKAFREMQLCFEYDRDTNKLYAGGFWMFDMIQNLYWKKSKHINFNYIPSMNDLDITINPDESNIISIFGKK